MFCIKSKLATTVNTEQNVFILLKNYLFLPTTYYLILPNTVFAFNLYDQVFMSHGLCDKLQGQISYFRLY